MASHKPNNFVFTQAAEILNKISQIKIGGITALNGTTMNDMTLRGMRNSSAELMQAIVSNQPVEVIRDKFDVLSGAIDAGALVGVIGQDEIKEYHAAIDNLRDEIDTEY